MRRVVQWVLAGVSLATGIMAIVHARQFDRSMKRAFALTGEDLP
jgi:hypothetical protein